jgi:hypothetical protein
VEKWARDFKEMRTLFFKSSICAFFHPSPEQLGKFRNAFLFQLARSAEEPLGMEIASSKKAPRDDRRTVISKPQKNRLTQPPGCYTIRAMNDHFFQQQQGQRRFGLSGGLF